ncbi:TIR domain-containing protein [candidate division KSB1 bacterium]|nr:TIR domain-containing protein [candidate division KSB1 bacterium]NIR73296.1 TIR domain-containing protein [candidate division KSB1 bacterium]NIS27002.1 TIR domain-containing protein [candidate division KSB1 bacterium]NIT73842.1 TIR domain-containing protein [candidate division KSB1 bacterium]NIU27747.1 TIR domain-containing protein [candidate division KSB1 bacterium]
MSKQTVFISYSHKDEIRKDRLKPHLTLTENAGLDIMVWDDRRIDTGEKWYPEIEESMRKASFAIITRISVLRFIAQSGTGRGGANSSEATTGMGYTDELASGHCPGQAFFRAGASAAGIVTPLSPPSRGDQGGCFPSRGNKGGVPPQGGTVGSVSPQDGTKELAQVGRYLNEAVEGLREAGTQHHIPRGLFARAELYRVQKQFARAREDLEAAFDIIELGEMRLWLTDYHLETARLCLAQTEETGRSPKSQKQAFINQASEH